LREHLSGALPGQVFLWLDIFAVNQHPGAEQADDLRNLKAAIQIASGTLVILDKEGGPLRRVWCLYEFWNTLKVKGPEGLHMLTGGGFSPKDMLGVLGNINVSEADATVASDKERILMDINLDVGITKFNAILKMLFLFNPLDYSSDISALKQHVKTSQWSLAKVHQWMRTPLNMTLGDAAAAAAAARVAPVEVVQKKKIKRYVPPPKPVYRVYRREGAPPWLLEEKRLRMKKVESESSSEPEPEEEAPVEESEEEEESSEEEEETDYETTESEEGSSDDDDDDDSDSDNERKRLRMRRARPGIAAAQNKRNAIQAQSANHLPEVTIVGSRVLAIYGSPGSGKTTLAVALCQEPGLVQAYHMCKHNDVRRQDIIKVLMSLAYQLGTCNELTELRDEYTSALSSDDAQRLVQPDDPNEIFEILLKRPLNKLQAERAAAGKAEPRVTILLDGLDEADGQFSGLDNRLLQFLRDHFATLPNWVRFIVTSRPRPHIKASLKYKYHAVELVPGHLRLTTDLQKQLGNRLVGLVHTDAVDAVAGLLVEQSNGSMVYLTVAIELLKRRKKALQSSAVGAVSAARAMANAQAIASEFPTSLADGYRQLFRQDLAKLSRDDTTRVMKLLEVLVAAREPLSPSQLHMLNLESALTMLPGGGILFYEREYRIYYLHKSLFDFMTDKDAAGEFYVDATLGHCTLGPALFDMVMPRRTGGREMLGDDYALRYTAVHLALAGNMALLEMFLLEFDIWVAIFARGFGFNVMMDLELYAWDMSTLNPTGRKDAHLVVSTSVIIDVIRWLKRDTLVLTRHPANALQCALDCPLSSEVRNAAVGYYKRPITRLLGNPFVDWPSLIAVIRGHAASVLSVAFSSDSRHVASGSMDSTARLWDAKTGQQVAIFEGHEDGVTSVAFSPDGTQLATASVDCTARLWLTESAQELYVIRDHGEWVTGVAFSTDGKMLATCSRDSTARVFLVKAHSRLMMMRAHSPFNGVAFHPDGKSIMCCCDDSTVRLYDIQTGQQTSLLKGHEFRVSSCIFSPDGSTALSSSIDKTSRLFDTKTGKELPWVYTHEGGVMAAVYAPDGSVFVTACEDQGVRVWDAKTNRLLSTKRGHTGTVRGVTFSSDSTLVASGADDTTVRLWDGTPARYAPLVQGHFSPIRWCGFSPDGTLVTSYGDDKSVRIWSSGSGQQVAAMEAPHDKRVCWACWAPVDENPILATCGTDQSVQLWSPGGEQLHRLWRHEGTVVHVSWSPDGSMLISSSEDGTARLWDAEAGHHMVAFEKHPRPVTASAFHPTSNTVATSCEDGAVRLWDTRNGKCLATLKGHTAAVSCVVFSSDGRLASWSTDGTARLWDTAHMLPLAAMRGHEEGGPVHHVAFSPGGGRLATCGQDGKVILWDSKTGAQLFSCTPPQTSITSTGHAHLRAALHAAFSPDAQMLATCSADSTVRVWNMLNGEQLSVVYGHVGAVHRVAWGPDGDLLASCGDDGTLRGVDLSHGGLQQEYRHVYSL